MRRQTLKTIQSAERAVSQLIEECGHHGVLHVQNQRAAAQVHRSGRWLLDAIAALQRELATTSTIQENKH